MQQKQSPFGDVSLLSKGVSCPTGCPDDADEGRTLGMRDSLHRRRIQYIQYQTFRKSENTTNENLADKFEAIQFDWQGNG